MEEGTDIKKVKGSDMSRRDREEYVGESRLRCKRHECAKEEALC